MLLPSSFYPLCPPSLSVYLSTFTVTALESQESKLPPSLSLPTITADPRFSLPLHLFPSQRLRFISLCVSGGMEGPLYFPSRQPALSCSSHAQPPTLPHPAPHTHEHIFPPGVGHLQSPIQSKEPRTKILHYCQVCMGFRLGFG